MEKQAAIEKILKLEPVSIDELLNIFPWQIFDMNYVLSEAEESRVIIAQKVTIEKEAEVKSLIFAEEVTIAEDAEVHGTVLARHVKCGKNAEINYLMSETLEMEVDSEIKYAVVQNSIRMEAGSEISEIDANHAIEADLSQEADILQINKIEQEQWDKMIPPRLNVVLSTLKTTL